MVATVYTADPLPSQGMHSGLHDLDPKAVLSRNLSAAFKKRHLSARSVERAIKATGREISNTTISNMLNGEGNPQLNNLLDVAKQTRIPLWQLLCPGIETSHFGADEVHELLEYFSELSEFSRKAALRNLKGQALLERGEKNPSSTAGATGHKA